MSRGARFALACALCLGVALGVIWLLGGFD